MKSHAVRTGSDRLDLQLLDIIDLHTQSMTDLCMTPTLTSRNTVPLLEVFTAKLTRPEGKRMSRDSMPGVLGWGHSKKEPMTSSASRDELLSLEHQYTVTHHLILSFPRFLICWSADFYIFSRKHATNSKLPEQPETLQSEFSA